MAYKLSLTDDQGVVLMQWMLGDGYYPLPVRKLGAQNIIDEINEEIYKYEGAAILEEPEHAS